jgi:putative CocE/NonD family hydrolase
MHNMPYDFGVPFLYGDLWWAKIVAGPQLDFSSLNSPLPNVEQLSLLPLETLDVQVLGIKIPFYRKWLTRTTEGDWKGFDFYEHLNNAHVPALQISGWFDGDGIGTKLIWSAERKLGRKDQWLIEGPWTHAFNTSSSIGKVNFGPSAIIDLDSLYLRWFDTWLKQKSVHLDSVPKAQIFVTGLNRWRKMSDWPSSSEKTEKMWLTSSAGGVPHALVPEIPPVGSESYTYDPSKDLETSSLTKEDKESDFTGEFNLASKKTGGFFVYKSTPFKHATDIAGPAELDLYFKTNTVNTDFFVDVVDVDPSGHAYLIGEPGKIRGSYLHGVDRIIPLVPGKAYEAKILPWDFAHEFKKGHRLGVVLSSTFFPLYARNLGTIDPISTATRMVVQRNTILFGKNHPSCFTYHILQP